MKKCLAIVAIPFLLNCGRESTNLSDKVSAPQTIATRTETSTADPRDYCNRFRLPSMHHLLDAYTGIKGIVQEGDLGDPSIKRMYDLAEREYKMAGERDKICQSSADYLLANLLAINSFNFMAEAFIRQEEARK